MSKRAFQIGCLVLVAMAVLAATEPLGATIGYIAGIVIALFGLGLAGLLGYALEQIGFHPRVEELILWFSVLYAALIAIHALLSLHAFKKGGADMARLLAFKVILLVGMPCIGILGLHSLTDSPIF